ncbi:MAG TPA: ParB/RepB/Spo0J family partition protein [Terriglobia bacterium]|nr:ParB/RepB/Spo0J family partition protein [Terriglobia bacterium]
MTRKALGRGLNALLREVETTTAGLEEVAVDLIDPNPFQPRRAFGDASLKELADSIRSSGVVQPVLLRRADGRYQLIAGERRWRAARLAGLEVVPAIVRDVRDREALELALTENLLREDLNALEAAQGLAALQEKHGLTHEEIAARLGLTRTVVSNTVRLLRLPPQVQAVLASGEISAGHARALVALKDAEAQAELARLIVEKGLSVRQTEEIVAGSGWRPKGRKSSGPDSKPDPNVRAAVLEMERTLGTRVKIVGNAKRGRIEIKYFSAEDLNRIYEWIVRR